MKFCLLVGLALVFVLYCEANLTDSCIACIGKVCDKAIFALDELYQKCRASQVVLFLG